MTTTPVIAPYHGEGIPAFTTYAHIDTYMPEENHTESVLGQINHFETYQQAAEWAEEWGDQLGDVTIVDYGKECPCPFC